MTEKTFLSIDLDYWGCNWAWEKKIILEHEEFNAAKTFFQRIESHARSKSIPLKVITSHEKILPYIEQTDFNRLVNVDFHDDMTSSPILCYYVNDVDPYTIPPNEGTWGFYVKGKESKDFEWVYPYRECYSRKFEKSIARCDPYTDIYKKNKTGWNSVIGRKGNPRLLETLLFDDVKFIVICYTRSWLRKTFSYRFNDLLSEYF